MIYEQVSATASNNKQNRMEQATDLEDDIEGKDDTWASTKQVSKGQHD